MGRAGRPGELNAALIYLTSNEAGYTTGSMLALGRGWTEAGPKRDDGFNAFAKAALSARPQGCGRNRIST